jgi:hypothetical protein
MERKQNIKRILVILASVLSGLIAAYSWASTLYDLPTLGDWRHGVLFGIVFLIGFFVWYAYLAETRIRQAHIRPNITKLNQLRNDGYLLRNKGISKLKRSAQVKMWIAEFEQWNADMLLELGKLDEDKAEWLRLLGNLPESHMKYPRIVNFDHRLNLEIFDEKLLRLDKVLEDYRNLPKH